MVKVPVRLSLAALVPVPGKIEGAPVPVPTSPLAEVALLGGVGLGVAAADSPEVELDTVTEVWTAPPVVLFAEDDGNGIIETVPVDEI